MNQFTIRDIENLCQIKAHTLRIWEQRYKVFVPKRKESKHRTYSDEDLKELLRIAFLYHKGYKISRIACLSCEEIRQAVATSCIKEDNHELFINQLIQASVDLDKEQFEKIVTMLVLRWGLEKCIGEIFYPFLQRIGLLWLTNHVIPAQEHFCSHIIRKKLICAIDALEPAETGMINVLVFAPTGEFHEIPLLVGTYFFKRHKIRITYFGINTSIDTLAYYANHNPCTHLFAHVLTNLCSEGLNEYINELSQTFPDKRILLSGPACYCLERKWLNIQQIHSFDELILMANEMNSSQSTLENF